MSDRIEELRKAYDDAADSLADATAAYNAAAADAAFAADAADDADSTAYRARVAAYAARRLWREAKAALEAAEREVRGE